MSESSSLSILIQAFDQTKAAFRSVEQSLSTFVETTDSAGERLVMAFDKNLATIQTLTTRIMSLTHVFMTFWILMDRARDHQISLMRSQIALTEVTWRVEEAQRNLNSAIAEFGPTSEEARKAAEQLWLAQEELRLRTEELETTQKGFNDLLIVGFVGAVTGAITSIITLIGYLGGPAGLYAAWISVHGAIDGVLFMLGQFGLAVTPFGVAIASYAFLLWAAKEDWLGLGKGIRMALGDLMLWIEDPLRYRKIPEVWGNLWKKLAVIYEAFDKSLREQWGSLNSWIADPLRYKTFPVDWGTMWDGVGKSVSDACEDIAIWFEGLAAGVVNWGAGLISGFISGLDSQFPGLSIWFVGLWTGITDGFKDLVEDAYQWGENLVKNFIDGFLAQVGLEEAAQEIPRTIGIYWGIGSSAKKGALSKLMEWGPNLVKTYAEGIESGIPLIAAAASKIGEAAHLGGVAGSSSILSSGSLASNRSLTIGAIQVNVTNSGSTADEIAAAIYRKVQRLM